MSAMSAVDFDYTVQLDDLIQFEVVHHLRQPELRAGARLRRFAVPAVGAGLAALMPLIGWAQLGLLPATAGLLGLAWALVYPSIERRLLAKKMLALAAKGAPRGGIGAYHARIDEDGVEVRAAAGQPRRIGWAALGPVVLDGPRTYLYVNADSALIFPEGAQGAPRAAIVRALRGRR